MANSQTFWDWFTSHGNKLVIDSPERFNSPEWRASFDAMQDQLSKASPGLIAEMGVDGDEMQLVISAGGDIEKFEAVIDLIDAAPEVAGWQIVPFRQRKPSDSTIVMGGVEAGPGNIRIVFEEGEDGGLDVWFILRSESQIADDLLHAITLTKLTHIFGEFDVETKIEGISPQLLAPGEPWPDNSFPPTEAIEIFDDYFEEQGE
ncbi:hypothetical protein [Microvirga flavescens]|uniref:hypothetical protein n=1 Tax=Microvirga flavescens TaxID=2249811 RepID=UPI000DD9770D|nr:hypothetical protein [Microvirga flavescens]